MPGIALAALLMLVGAVSAAHAQDPADRIARATEVSIPSSPALVLLGGDPATVVRPGFAEQYKLDLLVRDEGLAPDLALALRPVWTFLFQDVSASRYRTMSPITRALSTLTVSIGTTQDEDLRRMAWSVSLSPIRTDPLLDLDFVQGISALLDVSDDQLRSAQQMANAEIAARRQLAQIAANAQLTAEQRMLQAAEVAARLENQRAQFRADSAAIEAAITEDVKAYVADWRQRNWNRTAVDLGVGRLYEVTGSDLDEVDATTAGFGAWASAASGFGTDRFLFSALGRIVDLDDGTQTALGGNVRYGSARFDAFIEYIFREQGGSDFHEMAYGGALRLDDSRSVEFGLRTIYDPDFDLRGYVPVIKLNWLIGKTRLEDVVLDATGR